METGYPGTYDSVAKSGKEDLATVLDKDLSMCIMAAEILRTTTNVQALVKLLLKYIEQKTDTIEHPSIELWERLAARNSVCLRHLKYRHHKPSIPASVKGTVGPETLLWNSFGDRILHLDDLLHHIRCPPPVQQQKRVDYATLVRFLVHGSLFVSLCQWRQ